MTREERGHAMLIRAKMLRNRLPERTADALTISLRFVEEGKKPWEQNTVAGDVNWLELWEAYLDKIAKGEPID